MTPAASWHGRDDPGKISSTGFKLLMVSDASDAAAQSSAESTLPVTASPVVNARVEGPSRGAARPASGPVTLSRRLEYRNGARSL